MLKNSLLEPINELEREAIRGAIRVYRMPRFMQPQSRRHLVEGRAHRAPKNAKAAALGSAPPPVGNVHADRFAPRRQTFNENSLGVLHGLLKRLSR